MLPVVGGEPGSGGEAFWSWAGLQAGLRGHPDSSPCSQTPTECHLGRPRLLLQPWWVPGAAHNGCDRPQPAPPMGDGEKGVSPGALCFFSFCPQPLFCPQLSRESLLSLTQPLILQFSAEASSLGSLPGPPGWVKHLSSGLPQHPGLPPLQNLSSCLITESCLWRSNPQLCWPGGHINK